MSGPVEIVVFAEARRDAELATDLADRVIFGGAPPWALEIEREHLRTWRGVEPGSAFAHVRQISKLAAEHGVSIIGSFGGGADAAMARKAYRLAAKLVPDAKAALLVRDTDGQNARRDGLKEGRDAEPSPDRRLLAVVHPKAEAWVLAGFDPRDEREARRLEAECQRLGFDPRKQADRLKARSGERDAKRVERDLVGGDYGRVRACWLETPLDTLRTRGARYGLSDFMDEVSALLRPAVLHGR